MSEKAPTTNHQEVSDIVTVDDRGKGHRPDGKFLSNQNMELIAEHQEQIRAGLEEYEAAKLAHESGEALPDEKDDESYATRLRSTVGSHRTDGKPLDESDRLRRKLGITPEEETPTEKSKEDTTDSKEKPHNLRLVEITNPDGSVSRGVITGKASRGELLFTGWGPDGKRITQTVSEGEVRPIPVKEDDPSSTTGGEPVVESRNELERIGDAVSARIAELTEAGMSESEAHAQAHDEFWGSNSLDDSPEEGTPDTPEERLSPELERMIAGLEASRQEFARMRGNRSGKVFSQKFSKENLNDAASRWVESHDAVGAEIARLFIEAGATPEDIDTLARAGAVDESLRLSELTRLYSLESTGRVTISSDGEIEDKEVGFFKRRANKFYDWWARQQGVTGTIKKGAAGAALGLVPGILAGGALGVAGGGILAAAVGSRLAKGLLTGRINKNAHSERVAHDNEYRDRAAIDEAIAKQGGDVATLTSEMIAEALSAATRKDVAKNRKRQALMAGIAIAAGVAGGAAHDWIGDKLGADHTPTKTPAGSSTPEAAAPIDDAGLTEALPAPVDTSAFKYPWNWAEHEFGQGNGTPKLYELADKAQAAGHKVEWHGSGVNQWVEIDGNSHTDFVVNTLNQYR